MRKEIVEDKEKDKPSFIQKNTINFIIVLLLFIANSIGYARLSSTLKVSGSGANGGGTGHAKWDVHFENLVEKSDRVQLNVPATIKGNTTDIEYSVNLLVPGSYYEFEVDIKNNGTINAKLANEPSFNGITPAQDVYTNYTVKYVDNTDIRVGDVLRAGDSKRMKVRVEIEKDLTPDKLPTTAQAMNLSVDLDYIQAD